LGKINIGEKIAQYRKQKGLNIKEVSKKTGLTSSMLSQIERGNANPSINSLRLIAQALEVPLVSFFEDEENTKTLVVRANQRKKVMSPLNEEVVYESLSPHLAGKIQFTLMKLGPKMESAEKPMSHEGEEAALVLNGDIRLHLEDEVLELHHGDSVRIPPGKAHKWENKGDEEINVVFAVTPPSF